MDFIKEDLKPSIRFRVFFFYCFQSFDIYLINFQLFWKKLKTLLEAKETSNGNIQSNYENNTNHIASHKYMHLSIIKYIEKNKSTLRVIIL
jgi:hypothetical protein